MNKMHFFHKKNECISKKKSLQNEMHLRRKSALNVNGNYNEEKRENI